VINEVVIISDGVETLRHQSGGGSERTFESADQVIVHVIGFAVDSTADNKASAILAACRWTYATAPTIDEPRHGFAVGQLCKAAA
jgi:hypothetical protein